MVVEPVPKPDQPEAGPHVRPGRSKPVIPSLRHRLSSLSPQALAGFDAYMKTRKTAPDDRHTFAGNDASAELICQLSEAMLCFEQLRMEFTDQIDQYQYRGEDLPPRMYLMMSRLLSTEPQIVSVMKSAIDLHGELWELDGPLLGRKRRKKKSVG